MIKIRSLGGSGEDSRNCFLLETSNHTFLLDCGVRREIADISRVYPSLTPEIALKLDAVLLSHAHEDHTAALPYLYELGYRGKIYAHEETIRSTPAFLHKWTDYVKKNGGILPYDEDNIERLSFEKIEHFPYEISYGKNGHMVGGLWYLFSSGDKRILYTGDYTDDSLLLKTDPLPKADVLIIDSAYASRHLKQNEQYHTLYELAEKTVFKGGCLFLPVPANGRGIDMMEYLKHYDLPLYAESVIPVNAEKLFGRTEWLRDYERSDRQVIRVDDGNRREILENGPCGIFLFPDGMMTAPVSGQYYEAGKTRADSLLIISGHTAKGTLGNDLLQESFRKEHGVSMSVLPLTIKVHNDEEDVLRLVKETQAGKVLLFHSKKERCISLMQRLSNIGIECIAEPGKELIIEE